MGHEEAREKRRRENPGCSSRNVKMYVLIHMCMGVETKAEEDVGQAENLAPANGSAN